VLKAKPAPGDKVLVIGGGTIGLLTVAAVRALAPDAQVYCLTRYDFQQAVARKLGAEVIGEGAGTYAAIAQVTGGKKWRGYFGNEIILGGFHVVYDTVGNEQTLQNALRWTRGKGTVVVIGIHFKPGKLDYSPVWCQEVNVMGVNCHGTESDGRNSFDHAAELLDRGCVSPNDIITHRYPIANYKEAVKAFLNKGTSKAIKIVLDVE
jgi:threonine dehydrogenase-like Zn-dependent dehydrogenase